MFRWKPRFECPLLGIFWVQLRQGRIWQRLLQIATFPQYYLRFAQLSRKTEIATGKTDPSDLVWSKSCRGEKKRKKESKKENKKPLQSTVPLERADFSDKCKLCIQLLPWGSQRQHLPLCSQREITELNTTMRGFETACYLPRWSNWILIPFFVFDEYGR